MTEKLYLPDAVRRIIERLEKNGHEAYAVGGCVRDSLLGAVPGDYDIATSALPDEVVSVFSDTEVIPTGIKHGTVTVICDGIPYEITTYRTEAGYSDGRRPDRVVFTSCLRDDAARRDFTINAMAYNDRNGIQDFFGGRNDLRKGIIRCVGDPDARLTEDALRILRAIRFEAVLGYCAEPSTAAALHRNSEFLKNVSAERTADELRKLICGKNVRKVLLKYIDILGAIIPEMLPMRGFDQRNYHHIYDVLEHTAYTAEAVRAIPALRLAALFHDIGKPAAFTLDENGVGHFKGHPEISAFMADGILCRLRFSNDERSLIVTLVRHHDRMIEPDEKAVRRAINKLSPDVFFLLLELKRADNLAQAPQYRDRQALYDTVEKIARNILSRGDCVSRKSLAINGNDLIAVGITEGKQIGIILDSLLEKVLDGTLENKKELLLNAANDPDIVENLRAVSKVK